MIEKLLITKSQSLFEALEVINESAMGAAIVVEEENKLCGIVTDGDIRRSLLSGAKLQDPVSNILRTEFVYGKHDEPIQEIISKLSSKIRLIPIVDENMQVINYLDYSKGLYVPVATPNLSGNEFKYLVDAFLSTWISSAGKYIGQFEEEFAAFCECQHGVATSNGTTALHLALEVLGVGEGDEVIVPDLTFAATANTVIHANGTPVIVDINESDWCIDPAEIEKAITPKTKGIIPVHVYGQPCDMDAIMAIAKKHNLFVIEDCAEAHGAKYKGKTVGSFGDIGCFSFFGNKIITTGEGGMCVTNSVELDQKMRVLRDHGMSKEKRYWHEHIGYNYRMTNLQAAIGCAQLERYGEITGYRQEIEASYKEALSDLPNVQFQPIFEGRDKVIWIICGLITDGKRDEYMKKLRDIGIDTRPFFYSMGDMPIYQPYSFSNSVSQKVSAQGINFPTGKLLDKEIMASIRAILAGEQ